MKAGDAADKTSQNNNIRQNNKDLYHCTYKDTSIGVIINSKGEIKG